jgi:hypothetical protein
MQMGKSERIVVRLRAVFRALFLREFNANREDDREMLQNLLAALYYGWSLYTGAGTSLTLRGMHSNSIASAINFKIPNDEVLSNREKSAIATIRAVGPPCGVTLENMKVLAYLFYFHYQDKHIHKDLATGKETAIRRAWHSYAAREYVSRKLMVPDDHINYIINIVKEQVNTFGKIQGLKEQLWLRVPLAKVFQPKQKVVEQPKKEKHGSRICPECGAFMRIKQDRTQKVLYSGGVSHTPKVWLKCKCGYRSG